MQDLSLQQFLDYIKEIYTTAFLIDVYHNVNQHMSDCPEPSTNTPQPAAMSSSMNMATSATGYQFP